MSAARRSVFDRELRELDQTIFKLASMVDEAIDKAMVALYSRDLQLAQEVVAGDEQVNELRYRVEESALRVLATQQPMAGDLRRIIAVIHIAVELERIGDHAADIASLAERLVDEGEFDTLHKLPKMAKRARKMLSAAVEAFGQSDAEAAYGLIAKDEKIDRHYYQLRQEVFDEMRDVEYIRRASFLLWVGHDLERIGDRVTNIAERIIFMATGEFVESG